MALSGPFSPDHFQFRLLFSGRTLTAKEKKKENKQTRRSDAQNRTNDDVDDDGDDRTGPFLHNSSGDRTGIRTGRHFSFFKPRRSQHALAVLRLRSVGGTRGPDMVGTLSVPRHLGDARVVPIRSAAETRGKGKVFALA